MDTTSPPKVVISSQVDESVRERLEEIAAQDDRTLSAQVRRVLTAYVQGNSENEEEQ